jgi:hypothetical protein
MADVLGKVIRLTAGHQVKVVDKPEVREAGLTAVGVEVILILQTRSET